MKVINGNAFRFEDSTATVTISDEANSPRTDTKAVIYGAAPVGSKRFFEQVREVEEYTGVKFWYIVDYTRAMPAYKPINR